MLTQLSIIKMFYKSLNIFVRKFEKKEKREEIFRHFKNKNLVIFIEENFPNSYIKLY